MDWHFLIRILKAFGSPDLFINWISTCITTSTYSMHINGKRCGFIKPTRGISQGCPMSPYLFVFITEYLSLKIVHYQTCKQFTGIQLGRGGEWLTHLSYADDIVVFSQGKLSHLQLLKQLLKDFCSISGQSFSLNKSQIIFSKQIQRNRRSDIMQLLQMDTMPLQFKYLGNPIMLHRHPVSLYNFLIDRVQGRLKGWKQSILSHEGRETLIKSTISSLPYYFMSTYRIHVPVLKKHNTIARDFWWGYNINTRHMYFKTWSFFQQPKDRGGLAIRKLSIMSWSLLLKLSWQLVSNEPKWWVSCLLHKYGNSTDFWTLTPKSYNSRLWKVLLHTRQWLNNVLCRSSSNGQQTLVFKHI